MIAPINLAKIWKLVMMLKVMAMTLKLPDDNVNVGCSSGGTGDHDVHVEGTCSGSGR